MQATGKHGTLVVTRWHVEHCHNADSFLAQQLYCCWASGLYDEIQGIGAARECKVGLVSADEATHRG